MRHRMRHSIFMDIYSADIGVETVRSGNNELWITRAQNQRERGKESKVDQRNRKGIVKDARSSLLFFENIADMTMVFKMQEIARGSKCDPETYGIEAMMSI